MIDIYYIILDWYAEPILELEFTDEENEPPILETVTQMPLSYWLLFTRECDLNLLDILLLDLF